MQLFKMGDLVFHNEDIGKPTVMRVVFAHSVLGENGKRQTVVAGFYFKL